MPSCPLSRHCAATTNSLSLQSESVLIQKIYTHFKKTPGTHKLGVLYVVDSVTRQWVDQAKKSGQTPGSGAPDGTFAAGVTRVTELLPVLMNDIIATAPEDQKVRSTRSQVKDVITPVFHPEVILQHEQDVPTLLLLPVFFALSICIVWFNSRIVNHI